MPRRPASFVIQSRYVLLTYSRADTLDPFEIVSLVGSLGGECIVGREHHNDGSLHYHAFCDFGRKLRSRRADVLDVSGYHPNIEASRGNPAGGYDYAIKDGDVCAGGLARPGDDEGDTTTSSDIWREAVEAENRDEFFALLESCTPKNLVLNFPAIQRFADWRWPDREAEYLSPEGEFDLGACPGLDRWVDEQLGEHVRGESHANYFLELLVGGKPPYTPRNRSSPRAAPA